jgi:hypothetical protein
VTKEFKCLLLPLSIVGCLGFNTVFAAEPVAMGSLLNEMIDCDALAQ